MMDYRAQTTNRIFQYLLDVEDSLNCPIDVLIQRGIFNFRPELIHFVNKIDAGNFCILKKDDNTEHLFIIPLNKCPYDQKNGLCTDVECRKFHLDKMCYYYVYDKCKYGARRCKQRHRFNRRLYCFSSRYLTTATVDDMTLLKLIRKSDHYAIKICQSVDFNKCSNTERCLDSFHICKYNFTGGLCDNSSEKCEYGHSLSKFYDHNKSVLAKRNLDNVNELDLRNYLHDGFYSVKSKCKICLPLMSPPLIEAAREETSQVVDSLADRVDQVDLLEKLCVLCKTDQMYGSKRLETCPCEYCFSCFFKVMSKGNVCLSERCNVSTE